MRKPGKLIVRNRGHYANRLCCTIVINNFLIINVRQVDLRYVNCGAQLLTPRVNDTALVTTDKACRLFFSIRCFDIG